MVAAPTPRMSAGQRLNSMLSCLDSPPLRPNSAKVCCLNRNCELKCKMSQTVFCVLNSFMNAATTSTCSRVTALYSDVRIPGRQFASVKPQQQQEIENIPPTDRCPETPLMPAASAWAINFFCNVSLSLPSPLSLNVAFILLRLPDCAVPT